VLLWLYPHATGAKTGYTGKAGFCLVATARLSGAHFVAVVLGDTSSEASFADAASLLTYGFHALVRSRVISKGARLPPARVDGLEYPLAAAKALRAWVPADAGRPGVRIHLPSTRSTPRVGDRMGTAVLSLRGRVLGRVPAVVSGVPHVAPPPVPRETSTPWWQRGIDTVNRAADGLFHTIFG
jgi:D-alanyl-D-alanine carboxypeptidase (penicillin-binding protein 5/6)